MKAVNRQIVAEIRPLRPAGHEKGPRFPGKFATVSGGEITAAVEKVYDGGSRFPEVLCAPAEIGDITLTRHYDRKRDGAALREIRRLVGQAKYDIYVYVLNCNMKEAGTDRVYPEALLIGLSEPEGDSSSGAPAMFSLTFSIGRVK